MRREGNGGNTMDENAEKLMREMIDLVMKTDYVRISEIPDIALYMDQVTTFMDEHLENCKRHPEDKILTKTMINNYAKNNVLPPPEKKKYSKEHMIILTLLYYFKSFLSINDIQAVLAPVEEAYFGQEDKSMTDVYRQIMSLVRTCLRPMRDDIVKKYTTSQTTFKNAPEELQEQLHLFAFICLLSFDVYEKKRIIETLIDDYFSGDDPKRKDTGKKS